MSFMKRSLAVAAAMSLFNSARAWYPEIPACLAPFEPFVYMGCYDNGQPGTPEALSLRSDLDTQNMTVETCVAECKGNGYRLAGLSYYGVCYCGETVSTALLDESQCSCPCTGNSSETCGGDTEVNIWMDPTFEPLGSQTIADYTPVGCWTDDSDQGKALFYAQNNLDASTMTTETCLASCLAGGYPFAGTEYSGECYCGVIVGNGTALADDQTSCNMPCNGNADQICGGPARLSLYVATDLQSLQPCGYTPPSSSMTTPPPSSTTTTTPTPTSSTPVCTTTIVTPPTCEYKCGKWCSDPIPDWSDASGCLLSVSKCKVQIASCFAQAGWPDALKCFEYAEWCLDVASYCKGSSCKSGKSCNKPSCTGSKPPSGGGKPTTITSTYPCPTSTATSKTTTTKTTSTKTCAPTPTAICTQPTDNKYGFGPGNPVGGIDLPVVACNNIQNEWQSGHQIKLYTDQNSNNCPKYPRSQCSDACSDACKSQYQQCLGVYAEGCRSNSRSSRFGQSYKDAQNSCKIQYAECLQVNKNVRGDGHCTGWNKDCGCASPW